MKYLIALGFVSAFFAGCNVESSETISTESDAEADGAIKSVEAYSSDYATEMDRASWVLTASSNSSALYYATDGDDSTRWTTKEIKANDQYIDIDFGDSYYIDGVVLDSWESPRDYPDAYSVYVSENGADWGDPVAIGIGQSITEISFAAVDTRYLRIQQEGVSTKYWWSIHEIYVSEREVSELDSSNWSLSASNNNDDVIYAIDGSTSTRWTTEEYQTTGQYFQVDLGASETFDRIVLNSENSSGDYPRNYALYVSDDGSSWETVVYNGAGDSATTTIDFHDQTARYLKIEQLGSSDDRWWSIHELSIYADAADSETGNTGWTTLSSIDELRDALDASNGTYRMEPGTYTFDDFDPDGNGCTVLYMAGENTMIDFTDVVIDIPTSLLATNYSCSDGWYQSILIEGDGNTLINGSFINTYPNGDLFVTDFKSHNEDSERRPYKSNTYMRIWGDNTTLKNNSMIVRGSFPYGYGDMFGKGSGSTYGLKKHCAVLVSADDVVIDGFDLTQLAFCHGIFMQGSDNTTIRNTTVQGRVRLGADMYQDGDDSLPGMVDFLQQQPTWYEGDPIVEDRMYNLTEDGIRAYSSGTKKDGETYDTGSIYVEESSVTNMRNCFALVAADEAELEGVTVKGCAENGYSVPSGSTVSNAYGDAAYAPLIQMPYGNESNISMDITLIEPGFASGPYKFSNIAGSNHTIILRNDGSEPNDSLPILIGYAWDRWEDDEDNLYRNGASGITLYNYTERDVELTEYAEDNTVYTQTDVTDNGTGNPVQ
ncbi:discoidin domain-containing protein [Reinekea marinisedimentorum]|uniref:F5/8 type C domain-containing protein n=1 Tax=Reinekea marinisedimentorum TaxID=230495 RepID=A0A4R3I4Z1_9GAMM|nr:discoidin domain-containing protein [Reinekea marinisedimentorum]TCS40312.1 F5/8 type C domain-containing protein [Reinekea marinisedimentorum]